VREGELRLALQGRLDANSVSKLWPVAMAILTKHEPNRLIIDAGYNGFEEVKSLFVSRKRGISFGTSRGGLTFE
jgi:hypothetical protein